MASLALEDVQAEFERLSVISGTFTQPPVAIGPVTPQYWTASAVIASRWLTDC